MKVITVADIPDGLYEQWLHHLRKFDLAHDGCAFISISVAPNMKVEEAISIMMRHPFEEVVAILQKGDDDEQGAP